MPRRYRRPRTCERGPRTGAGRRRTCPAQTATGCSDRRIPEVASTTMPAASTASPTTPPWDRVSPSTATPRIPAVSGSASVSVDTVAGARPRRPIPNSTWRAWWRRARARAPSRVRVRSRATRHPSRPAPGRSPPRRRRRARPCCRSGSSRGRAGPSRRAYRPRRRRPRRARREPEGPRRRRRRRRLRRGSRRPRSRSRWRGASGVRGSVGAASSRARARDDGSRSEATTVPTATPLVAVPAKNAGQRPLAAPITTSSHDGSARRGAPTTERRRRRASRRRMSGSHRVDARRRTGRGR